MRYLVDKRTNIRYPEPGQPGLMAADLKEDVSNVSGKPVLRCMGCGKVAYTSLKYADEAVARLSGYEHYLGSICRWYHVRPKKIVPRDYQNAAHDSLYEYFGAHDGNPVIAMPTGTGKSIVIADFIKRAFLRFPRTRVVSLTHVKELIEQNHKALLRMWPTAPAGVYSAGLNRRESRHPITFAGIQSVYKKAEIFGHVDIIIIDECHLVAPRAESMYAKFIGALKERNPYVKVIGFSATPYRMKHGMLTEDDGIFTDIAFDLTTMEAFNWLIAKNYLSPLVPRQGKNAFDLSGVAKNAGDFVQSQLQKKVDHEDITLRVLNEAVPLADGRDHWLVFTSGIEHAEHVADYLNDRFDIPAEAIHSKLSSDERDARITLFKRGNLKALVNYNILTTGFDAPFIDCILMMRATLSPGLWVQMLGRGTRPFEGKKDCLVLDFANNTRRLGPINDPVLPRARGKGPPMPAPVRLCEHCYCYSHASARFCQVCGEEFPRNLKLSEMPSIDDLIADAPPLRTYEVSRVVYAVHKKEGRPDSMRVDYYCGLRRFREYICLDHSGYAKRVAKRWWKQRCKWGVPPSTHDGMAAVKHIQEPIKITVLEKKRWPEIAGYEFA